VKFAACRLYEVDQGEILLDGLPDSFDSQARRLRAGDRTGESGACFLVHGKRGPKTRLRQLWATPAAIARAPSC